LRIGVVNYLENFASKVVIYRENLHFYLANEPIPLHQRDPETVPMC